MVVLDRVACAQGVVMEVSTEDGFDIWETGLTGLGDELDTRSEERGLEGDKSERRLSTRCVPCAVPSIRRVSSH